MIGQTIGDYRLTDKLGEGGFGKVYKAAHLLSEQEVAIKTISSVLTDDPKFRQRFFDEAKFQAKLKHPHIVVMHNFFEHRGRYYIVLEYMEGVVLPDGSRVAGLAELIKRGPVPGEELLPLFRPVLDAVGYAHRHGILHRDIKPLNILFAESGALKVADFGIAKMVGGDTSVSMSGTRVGTPAYMSPEQVFDKRLTRTTDIYSLGCTLYEAATGKLPFKESDTSSLLEAHVSEPPIPPRSVNPGIGEGLERAILKAMAKKPGDRFQSCEEFAAALAGAGADTRPRLAAARPALRVVPSVLGLTRPEVEDAARQSGCEIVVAGEEHSETVPAGRVLAQEPGPGSFCAAGEAVRVRLSRGRKPAVSDPLKTVPDRSRARGAAETVPEPGDRRPFSPSPFPPPQERGREREGAWGERRADGGERPAAGGPGKRAGWAAVAVVAAIAVVVLVAVTGGRNRGRDAAPTGPDSGQQSEASEPAATAPESQSRNRGSDAAPAEAGGVGATSQSRFVSRGRNAQGYEERLWLKDSSVMVKIPAGEFTMGSTEYDDEKPVHRVYLDEYWIDKHEVTNRQFEKFVKATGYRTDAEKGGDGYVLEGSEWVNKSGVSWRSYYNRAAENHPVVLVSWNDAKTYCGWAGKRLPTEAEWEKAARGTDGRKYPWGNSEPTGSRCNFADRNTDFGWSDKKADDGYARTAPVGSFPAGASPYGLLDMAGNVWEWCNDWYDNGHYGRSASSNPQGPSTGSNRVLRGGSWDHIAWRLRAASRGGDVPSRRLDCYGFRSAH